MPYISLPDGRDFKVPSGLTDQEALGLAQKRFPKLYADTSKAEEGFIPSFMSGIEGLKSSLSTATAPLFGTSDADTRQQYARFQARQSEIAKAPSFEDVKKAQTDYGIFGGAKPEERGSLSSLLGLWRGQFAESLPQMGATLGGARLGAMAGSAVAPGIGTVIGGGLGALAASIPAFTGTNVERNIAEQEQSGKKEPLEYGKALATAVPQAALDVASQFFILGKLGVGKPIVDSLTNIAEKFGFKAAEDQLLKVANRKVAAALAGGTAKGVAIEVPTEIAQQVLERAQANLPLLDKSAMDEYIATGVGVAGPGGAFGAYGGYRARSAAKTQVAEQEEAKQAAERVKRKALAAADEEKAGQLQAFTDIPTQLGGAPAQTQTDLFQDVAAPYSPLPSIGEKENEKQVAAREKEDTRRSIFEEHQKVSAGVADLTKTAAEARNRQDWETYEASRKQLIVLENAQEELEKKAKQEGVALPTSSASVDAQIQKLEEKIRKAATKGESVASFLPELNALKQQKQQSSYQGSLFEKTPEWEKADAAQEAAFTQQEKDAQAEEKARVAGTSMFEQAYGEEENRREEQARIVRQRAFEQDRKQKQEEYAAGKAEKDVTKFAENAPIAAILVGQGRELNDTAVRRNSINAINDNLEQGLVTKDVQNLLGLKISKSAFSLQTAEEAQEQTKRRVEQSKELATQKVELEKKLSASGESTLQNEEMRALLAVTNKKFSTPEELMRAYRYGLATRNEVLTNEAAAQLSEQEGAVETARKGEVSRATANAQLRVKEAKDKAEKSQIKIDLEKEVDSINAQYTKNDAAFSVLTYGAFQPHSNIVNLKNKRQADVASTAIRARIEELEQERKTRFPNEELIDEEGNFVVDKKGKQTKAVKEYIGLESSLSLLKRLLAQAQRAKPEPMQPQLAASRAVEQEKARENAVFEFGNTVDSIRKGEHEGQNAGVLLKQAYGQIKEAQDAAVAEINYRRVERDQRALTAAEEKEVRDGIAEGLKPLLERTTPTTPTPMLDKMRVATDVRIAKQEKKLADLREKKAYLPAIFAVEKRIEALKGRRKRLTKDIARGRDVSNTVKNELANIRKDIQSIISNKNKEPSKYGVDFGSVAEIEEQQRVQKERQEPAETPDKTDFGSVAEIEEQKRVQEERRASAETFLSSASVKERVEKRMAPIRAEADRRIEAIEKRAARRKPWEKSGGIGFDPLWVMDKSLARAATLIKKDAEEIQGIKKNVSQRYEEIQKIERQVEKAKGLQKTPTPLASKILESGKLLFNAQKEEVQALIKRIEAELDHQIDLASKEKQRLVNRKKAIAGTRDYATSMVERGEKDLYTAEQNKKFDDELKDIEKEKDFQERLMAEIGSSEHFAFLIANDKKVQSILKELNRLEKWTAKAKTEQELANAKKRAGEALAATKKLAKERADKTRGIVSGVHEQFEKWKAAGIARTSNVEFLTYKEAVATIKNLKKQVETTAKQLGLSKAEAFDVSAVVQKTDKFAELNKQRKEMIALFRFYEKQASDLAPLVQQMDAIADDIKELSARLGIDVINAYKPLSYPTKPDPQGKLNDKRLELIERYDSVLQQLRIKERPKTEFADFVTVNKENETRDDRIKELSARLGISAYAAYDPSAVPTIGGKAKTAREAAQLGLEERALNKERLKLIVESAKENSAKGYSQQALETATRNLPHAHARVTAQLEVVQGQLKKSKKSRENAAAAAKAAIAKVDAAINKEKSALEETKLTAQEKSLVDQEIKALRVIKGAEENKFNSNSTDKLEKRRAELDTLLLNIEAQAKKYGIDLTNYAAKDETVAAQAKAVAETFAAERRGEKRRNFSPPLRTGSPEADRQEAFDKLVREERRNKRRDERAGEERYSTDEAAAAAYAINPRNNGPFFESRGEEPVGEVSTKKSVYADLKKAFKTDVENRVTVYQTVAEARADNPEQKKNINDDTRGFVLRGKAFLIAENIEKGKALSVLLHELGVHIGFKNLFNAKEFAALVNVVKQWAARKDNSVEARVGRAAMDRVKEAKVPANQMDEELLAYAVEEAVSAGVNPSGVGPSGAIRAWFSRIVKGFREALIALRLAPDTLTAQNVVDFAYGAANIELETEISREINLIAKDVFNEPLTELSTKPSWNAELSPELPEFSLDDDIRPARAFKKSKNNSKQEKLIPIGKFGPVKNAYIKMSTIVDLDLNRIDVKIYVVDKDILTDSEAPIEGAFVDIFKATLLDPERRNSTLKLSTMGVPGFSTYVLDKYKNYITEENGYYKLTPAIVGNATVAKIWRTLRNEIVASGFVDTGTTLSFFRATSVKADTDAANRIYDSKYIANFSRGEPQLQDVKTDEIFFSRGKAKMPAGFEAVQEFADAAISADKTWLEKVKSQSWAQTALGIKIAKFDRIAAFEELADKMIKAGNGNQAMQMMYDLQGLSDVMSMASASAYDGALVRVKDPNRPGEYRYQASGGASLRSTDKLLKPLLNQGFTPEGASNLFTAYMVTLRGKSVGYEKLNFSDEVQKMIKDVIPNIQTNNEVLDILNKAREEYNEYNKGQIEFLESSGQISHAIAQEMRSKKDYIPYYRDVQGSLKLFIGDMNPVTLGDLKHQKHLQKLVGGEQKILNYFDSSMQNTMILTDLALTNFAKRNTITALNTLGLLQPIGGTKGPTIRNKNGPENANVIRFKDNGDDKHVVVNTEGTPYEYIPTELLIKGLEGVPFVLPDMVKMLGAPAQWLRKGITLNPLYPYYQLVKDSNAMGVTRGVSYSNIISVLKGIKSYLSNEKLIKELQSRGVIQQREMFSGSTEDSTINRRRIVGGENGFQQFLAGQEGRAIKADGAVRATLYDAYIKQGLSERDAEYMIRKAMPYSRRGLDPSLRYLSHMIPFFNAQIVGLYSLYQSFRGQGPMSEKLQIKKKLFAAGMNMALGTLIYSALVSGEEWYENMPMETRLRNWLIKVPGFKEPVAVPIPFEFGIIFKSFFEATYMGMFNDTPEGKQVAKAFRKLLLSSVPGGTVDIDAVPIIGAVPMPLPTAAMPLLEVAFNKSAYTGAPIETRQDLEKIPEERFRDTTSELAKTLGKTAGISPLQIDSLIRGYTGTVGPAVIALIDAFTAPASTTGDKPEKMLSKTPLLSQIFKPVDGGAIINMAIETLNDAAQIENTYKSMLNEGREAEAEKFLTKNMSVIERGPASLAGKFRQQLGEFKKAETAVKMDQTMNAKQKRDELDELRSYKIQLGKDYMQAFRSGA